MPKILGRSLAQHRERTRDALFDALARIMAEKGFDQITMSELASEAGIGRTAIYNHFSDKEEVLMAFVAREMRTYMTNIESSLESADDPLSRLRIYVRSQLLTERAYLNAPGPPLVDVISKESARQMGQHIRQTSDIFVSILDDCVAAGLIPDNNRAITSQLVHGALTGRRVPREEPARSMFFDATERFVLQAIGAQVPQTLSDLGPIPGPACDSVR